MNKKAKSWVFGITVLFLISIVAIAIISAGFGIVFPSASVTNTDIFYSPYETWLNLSVNATVMGPGTPVMVRANLTKINASACGSGYLNMTYNAGTGLWVGNCTVASFINSSQVNPTLGNISFIGTESDGTNTSSSDMVFILAHNLGVPSMVDPTNCTRFGSSTTNMSIVPDFAHVNFVVRIQVNFTCQTLGIYNGTQPGLFEDVMLMNLTSVNMTQSDIGTKLAALKDAIVVNISSPRTFEPSRIWVDSAAFSALNTSGNITLYNLPFTGKPGVIGDDGSALTGDSIQWYPGGYSSARGASLINLTFAVGHFSGYNTTDASNPLVSFAAPNFGINISSGSVLVQVLVNGTGTEPSYISITGLNATVYSYNGTSGINTANCQNISSDRETWNCSVVFSVAGLAEGSNTITVNAYDYGGTNGNLNSSTRMFTVDRTGPAVIVISPANSYTRGSVLFNVTSIDALTSATNCWTSLNNGVNNFLMTKIGDAFNYTNSSIVDGNYLARYYCNDTLGNMNNSVTTNFTVDTGAPRAANTTVSGITSSAASIYYTSNESVNATVTYRILDSLGSSASTVSYASSGSVALSGLSASTFYYYNISVCDQAGNCAVNGTLFNFTTSAASTDDGSGGTSGGGTFIPAAELTAGVTKSFYPGEALIFRAADASHTFMLLLISFDATTVTIQLSSTPQRATMSAGEEKNFDLNADGLNDVYVKVNSINKTKADITIRALNESATDSTDTEGTGTNAGTGTTGDTEGTGTATGAGETAGELSLLRNPWFWSGIAIVLIIIIIISIAVMKGKK